MTQVSVTQFTSSLDVDENTLACRRLIERASEAGADIVVLPEAAMYPPPGIYDAPTISQDLDGQFVTELSATAGRRSVHVVAGMFRPGPEGKVFNTLVSIGHDGSLLGKYDKIHLYDAFASKESDEVAPGPDSQHCDPLHTFELGNVRFGLATCYDLRFPELFRSLVDVHVAAFILPAAWYCGERKLNHWTTLLTARAVENTSYIIAANQNGSKFTGPSMIVDPHGDVVAGIDDLEDFATADIDPNVIDEARDTNPCLRNRRFTIGLATEIPPQTGSDERSFRYE